MIFKAIAHWWASSNLEKEEARTKSLIRELDREKEAVKQLKQEQKLLDEFSTFRFFHRQDSAS